MHEDYALREGPPSAADAVRLRARAGLSPRTLEQAAPAMVGSWSGVHVVHVPSGAVVAMGRVIGDGGWYFHICDMATEPDHQRLGIGEAVLVHLLDGILAAAPATPYITLLADEPGRPLYRRVGFVDTAPGSIGMVLRR